MSVNLISDALRKDISAELVKYTLVPRSTYDGEGFDIFSEFCVLWRRSTPSTAGGENWGTHRGTIRGPQSALKACLFIGHYDMDEEDAREDFCDRQGHLD